MTMLKAGIYWVVLRVCPFEITVAGSPGISVPVAVRGSSMVGYLPVYNTEEDAAKDYPDGPFAQIRVKEKP